MFDLDLPNTYYTVNSPVLVAQPRNISEYSPTLYSGYAVALQEVEIRGVC
jgi:hypothetical protein